ncbi:MAG: hypothetical protein Q6356_008005 [Candidatus Wukongarchaeota archaeon]|nr:hypothetical protein [Candidatus Wukongarchaeota archaeon]
MHPSQNPKRQKEKLRQQNRSKNNPPQPTATPPEIAADTDPCFSKDLIHNSEIFRHYHYFNTVSKSLQTPTRRSASTVRKLYDSSLTISTTFLNEYSPPYSKDQPY